MRPDTLTTAQRLRRVPVEVVADSRDEFIVVQPYDVRTAANSGVVRLKAKSRYTIDLFGSPCVIQKKMLARVAKITDTAGRVDIDCMARRRAIEVTDPIGVGIIL